MNIRLILFIVFVLGITFAGSGIALSQGNAKDESSDEKFYRSGGKSTAVKTIYRDGEYSIDNISDGRDLATYENGGHFFRGQIDLADVVKSKLKDERELAIIRNFIWKMWNGKKKGYIRITYHSVDAATTSHIFIETDKDRKSHISWRLVRHNDEIDDLPNITTLVQRKTKPGDVGDFVLIFKGKDGEVWQRL